MRRLLLSIAILLPVTAFAAPLPESWQDGDVAPSGRQWYGVAVAEFPSAKLAGGVEKALLNENWGPVRLDQSTGQVRVVAGEFLTVAEADFFRREMDAQGVAAGRVVPIPPDRESPRMVSGPLSPPFSLPMGGRFSDEAMVARLDGLRDGNDLEEGEHAKLREAALSDVPTAPDAGSIALLVAKRLHASRLEADLVTWLLCRVAAGTWPTSTPEREEAQGLAVDMIHGHLNDWAGAWSAARKIAGEAQTPTLRTEARIRQAALTAELIREGVVPAPEFSEVRRQIRFAYENAPEEPIQPLESLETLYIQSFAWEGRWDRVENLSDAFLEDRGAEHARGVVVQTLLAKSILRKELYGEARELLMEAITTRLEDSQFFQLGYTRRDPRNAATVALRQLGRLESGADPVAPPVTVEQEEQTVRNDGMEPVPMPSEEPAPATPADALDTL